MRRGRISLKSRNTLRHSSPASKEQSSLSFHLESNKRLNSERFARQNKPRSQSPSSQPVIKLLILLFFALALLIRPVSAAWANSTFGKCQNITITNPTAENLTNFPAYINLTYDSDMLADFLDIRFYNASCSNDGTIMDYEIENYTTSTNAHIWTRIPTLPSTGTTISVYYDNNTAITSGENPTGVWDTNYKGVWHMTETDANDSTSNSNNGTEDGGVTFNTSGKIDGADSFTSDGFDYINCGNDSSLNMGTGNFTLEGWTRIRLFDTTSAGRSIMGKTGSVNTYTYKLFTANDGYANVRLGNASTFANSLYELDLRDGQWHHVAARVIRGGFMNVFVDGNKGLDYPFGIIITGTINSSNPLYIGQDLNWSGGIPLSNHTLDEVRISNTARSDSWINMSYRIVANQSQYVSFGGEESRGTWANSNLDRCKNITITNSGSETLTNFPAYINLTYDSDMLSDFLDIRFYNASCNNDGVLLDYEIENYTTSNRSHIWVRIPSLPSTGTTISVYYDNNTAITSGENPTGVWDSNYKGVWHMQRVNATDSTSNANHGTQSGGVTLNSTGKIDGADEFNRSQDINITENTPLNFTGAFSYGAWWKKNNWINNYGGIFTRQRGVSSETYNGYSMVIEDYNHVDCYYTNGTTDEHVISDDPDISTNTWYYTECVWNGSAMLIYLNGVKQADKGLLTSISHSNYSAKIGKLQGSTTSFRWNGTIDEVRVSNTSRSASWINMSYLIVNNQSTYVSFGSEENIPSGADTVPPTININISLNNTVTTDTTPSVDFNFTDSESSTANCTLYFNNNPYNITNNINNNTQKTLTVNASLSDGNYSVYINCTDTSSNIGKSGVLNIEIDTTAPAVTDVISWSITGSSAKVNWTTNEEANGSVKYGQDTDLTDGEEVSSDLVIEHSISLSSLSASTLYYYNITSCDAQGFCNTSGVYNFTTTEGPSCTAPVSGNWNVTCSDNCAWTTNQYVSGNMILNGSGHVKVSANLTFTSAEQYIIINSGCTFEIRLGGEIKGSTWASDTMDKCMNITISNCGSEALTNFPAYINLTYDSDMLADFLDIRFYDTGCNNGGTALDYEIENYTTSTNAHIWTRIPTLPSTGTTISVYYDNNTAITSGENPTGVWDTNYKGVWHMQRVNATDSTSNANNGNQSGGVTQSSGKIATADVFYRNGTYINIGNQSSLNMGTGNFTMEAWVKYANCQSEYCAILQKGTGCNQPGYLFLVMGGNNRIEAEAANSTGGNIWFAGTSPIAYNDSQWHHAVIRADRTNQNATVFIDGAYYSADDTWTGDTTVYSPNPFWIGTGGCSGVPYTLSGFNGTIDEVRMSNTIRSASWINMSYLIVNNQSRYVSLGSEESRETWANSNLDMCMNITITNTGSETLTNFPAYINLTYDGDMQPDFTDIRFYDTGCNNGGTALDYEIENYTTSNRSHIWVRIPSLPSTGTTISVYYDNNTAITSGENPTGVWDSSYVGVWHMTEVNATDSTQHQNNGTETGGVTQTNTGRIAGAGDFDGQDDTINCSNDASLNFTTQATIEAWVNCDNLPDNYRTFLHKGTLAVRNGYYFALQGNERIRLALGNSTASSGVISIFEGETCTSNWQHMVAIFDTINNNRPTYYINGALGNFENASDNTSINNLPPINDLNYELFIGSGEAAGPRNNFFNGTIDEVRISNTVRSDSWINMSYRIVNNQSQYVSFGSEQTR